MSVIYSYCLEKLGATEGLYGFSHYSGCAGGEKARNGERHKLIQLMPTFALSDFSPLRFFFFSEAITLIYHSRSRDAHALHLANFPCRIYRIFCVWETRAFAVSSASQLLGRLPIHSLMVLEFCERRNQCQGPDLAYPAHRASNDFRKRLENL